VTISIRGFLIGVLLSTFTLLNFVAVLKGYEKGLETTRRVLDDELQDMAKLLATHSTRAVHPGEADRIHTAYQIIRDGQIQERSFNAPETFMAELTRGFAHANFLQQRWRIYAHYESESQIWVLVAEPEQQRNRIAESVVLHTITPMLVAIPVAGLLIWLVIGVGLKPLSMLSQQLKQKPPTDLSPLQLGKMPAELQPVINALDEWLARLRQAFDREKHFAAEAAHELRTPVSVLKIHLHNLAASLPGNHTELNAVKAAADQLAHLVEQLLDWYRSNPEIAFFHRENVNLEALVQEALARAFDAAQKKHQHLELIAAPAALSGNPFALTTLLNNLIGNAIKYTPEQGLIRVCIEKHPDRLELIVEDSGPGITEENRPLVLQRFYRQHQAGEQQVPGAGLGLAIVAHITQQHRAKLTLETSPQLGGLLVRVRFDKSGETT
jgi:two-component system sensor histidine kinase QseC